MTRACAPLAFVTPFVLCACWRVEPVRAPPVPMDVSTPPGAFGSRLPVLPTRGAEQTNRDLVCGPLVAVGGGRGTDAPLAAGAFARMVWGVSRTELLPSVDGGWEATAEVASDRATFVTGALVAGNVFGRLGLGAVVDPRRALGGPYASFGGPVFARGQYLPASKEVRWEIGVAVPLFWSVHRELR